MRGKHNMKWIKDRRTEPEPPEELAKSQVTIMKAVEEAILFLEGKDHYSLSEEQERKLTHDNLVRALGDLQKLRKGLGDVENAIVAMGCEISGH